MKYLSSTSPSSQTGGRSQILTISALGILSAVTKNTSTFPHWYNNFPAQSLHLRFGSVAPCPTLKPNVTASAPRTRYGQVVSPYPIGFPYYISSAYQEWQNFFRSFRGNQLSPTSQLAPMIYYNIV